MMAKFNVGDKVRILDVDAIEYGEDYYYNGMETEVVSIFGGHPVLRGKDGDDAVVIVAKEYHAIERITDKPKKSARITALETQVATLQAKVEALESAGKYPLTERFERESTSMDAILADIERKAKPTLEALLATYPAVKPTPNEQRADVIKRAKAFVAKMQPLSGRRVSYVVNAEKRTVVALTHRVYFGIDSGVHARGIAKCDPDDVFNADIGKAIALARALGVEVPVEFVKAVQPSEVVVGMVVETPVSDARKVVRIEKWERGDVELWRDNGMYVYADRASILDDTDAVYE